MTFEKNIRNEIKEAFTLKFDALLYKHKTFRSFILDIFIDASAYVVGGFIRDIFNNKSSRDLDIIIDLPHDKILYKLNQHSLNFKLNRHNGLKIFLNNFEVDLWSIDNNWAFKNRLVKKPIKNKSADKKVDALILERIACGSFYNYDALVINVHTKNLHTKYYNDFINNRTLDILQKNDTYKALNPTIEANVLRAIFLYKAYNISFSMNAVNYLYKSYIKIKDQYNDEIKHLNNIKLKYIKYCNLINYNDIVEFKELMSTLQANEITTSQYLLEL